MEKKNYMAPEMEAMDVKTEIVCASPGLPIPDPVPDPTPVDE